MTAPNALETMPDAILERMIERAWREASRCWAEYRLERDPAARAILLDGARSAEDYWRHLGFEQTRRRRAR